MFMITLPPFCGDSSYLEASPVVYTYCTCTLILDQEVNGVVWSASLYDLHQKFTAFRLVETGTIPPGTSGDFTLQCTVSDACINLQTRMSGD